MPLSFRPLLRAFALAACLPLSAVAQQGGGPGPGPGGAGGGGAPAKPAQAGYMVVEAAEVPVVMTLTGRAVAQNTTRIRPRVGGVITAILYEPGSLVTEGTPLFSIDPLTYEVSLASARSTLAGAEADLATARTGFDRASRLRETNTSSAATFEEAQATLRKAEASKSAAEAALRLAEAQLDWTTVRAPITGIVGLPEVSLGDLVTQNQSDALAEIVQTDPVQVDLTEPYPARLRIDARVAAGEVVPVAPELALLLDDGRRVEGQARLVTTGATVSTSTGTRILRFELANPQGLIAPGMFLHAELTVGRETAILVPQRAAERQRDGTLTAWIVVDGKASRRTLTETGTWGNAWVIRAGLEAGDWLLVDGITNLREGREMAPVPAMIDEQGVVRDASAQGMSN